MFDPRLPNFVVSLVIVCLTLPCSAQPDFSAPGPFAVSVRTVSITRADTTTFTARLAYPATSTAANAPLDPAAGLCPAVSFGHGFLQSTTQYASTMDHLATWGYIVIASNSQTGLFPSHAAFAADLRLCLTHLEQQNADASSFLFGRVDASRLGMSGHSMGGGCSILAAAADPRVKAIANLAAAETNPSAIALMPVLRVPVALIAGSSDTIVPPSSNAQPMYAGAVAPRQLVIISGGYHCGFTDANFIGCDSSATLTRTQQLAATRRLLTEFFELHLRANQAAWNSVWGPGGVTTAAIARTRDPGLSLTAPGAGVFALPGAGMSLNISVANSSLAAQAFDVLTELVGPAPASISAPLITPPLAPGQSVPAALMLTTSPTVALPASVIVSARSTLDGATRAYATLTLLPGCNAAGLTSSPPCCPADFNRSGVSSVQDIFDFLAVWFLAHPSADFNTINGVSVQDLFDFLAAWFSGCP